MEHTDPTLALITTAGERSALARLAGAAMLPFGADRRVLDFPIGNCLTSGLDRIALLTSAKSRALVNYVQQCAEAFQPDAGEFIELWPEDHARGPCGLAPSTDVLLQNIELIAELAPKNVLVLGGHQVYRTDYRSLLEGHAASGAGVTIGCVEVPVAVAREHDVVTLDSLGRVLRIDHRPGRPARTSGDPPTALVATGICIFDRDLLIDGLLVDAADAGSRHQMTRDLLPLLIRASGVRAHVLRDLDTGEPAYWRDVAGVDGYWRANMDLLDDGPKVDLANVPMPVRQSHKPAPRFLGAGRAERSIIAGGCTVEGTVQLSVVSADCRVGRGALVASSIVFPSARVGTGCTVRNAIVGAGCVIPDNTVIGEDASSDAERFGVSPRGVVMVLPETVERAGRRGLKIV
jgi:glucose-1-phosphate adenylyltransferase